MGDNENRHIARDSLFVMARMRLGDGPEHNVRVRNLSAGGLMAEGSVKVQCGDPLTLELRNIGWVDASVAWVHGARFGVAFAEDIDPMVARAPAAPSGVERDLLQHRPMGVRLRPVDLDPRSLRKV